MNAKLDAEQFSSSQERLLRQFEQACQCGTLQSLEELASQFGRLPQPLLLELIHLDLEYRFKAQRTTRIEAYLPYFPFLQKPDVLLDLLAAEIELRQAATGPSLEEYLERFPGMRWELLHALEHQPVGLVRSVGMDDSTPTSRQLGRYRLDEVVGQGAFGKVYKAFDTKLCRTVALKVPHVNRSRAVTSQYILDEARTIARLDHPHITAIYETVLDQTEGNYIAGQFIVGKDLSEVIAQGKIDSRTAVNWIEKLTTALEYAHSRQVLHCDIKPSNILVGDDRNIWLTDFGLSQIGQPADTLQNAAATVIDSDLRYPGGFGTLAYSSPEQVGVIEHRLDQRADIYSLGIVLYELLTGRLPFTGNVASMIEQLRSCQPPNPRQFSPAISKDLEEICLKAISKLPEDRYQTMQEFGEDLRRHQLGLTVSARPIGRVTQAARWCRRKPMSASLLISLIGTVIGGTLAVGWQWRQTMLERNLAQQNLSITLQALAGVVQAAGDSVRKDSNTHLAMERVLQLAHDGYSNVLTAESQRVDGQLTMVRALIGLGHVATQQGELVRAESCFQRAQSIIEHASLQENGNSEWLELGIDVLVSHAAALRRSDQTGAALNLYYQARSAIERHAVHSTLDRQCTQAEVYWYIAEAERKLGQNEQAAMMVQRAIACWEQLGLTDTPASQARIGLAKGYFLLASIYYDQQHLSEALSAYRIAARRFKELVQAEPTAENFRRDLGACYHNLARVLHEFQADAECTQLYIQAIDVRQRLVEQFPNNPKYAIDLEGSLANLAAIQAFKNP